MPETIPIDLYLFTTLKPQLDAWYEQRAAADRIAHDRRGEDARALRKRLQPGWSCEKLSLEAGLSLTHGSKIETGSKRARPATIAKLARALGCPEKEYAAAVAVSVFNHNRKTTQA